MRVARIAAVILAICAILVAQHGYALPGTVLVCSDSHTGSGSVNQA
jgi:homoaconitase/3-isopropylmalate dehydratase large subunit